MREPKRQNDFPVVSYAVAKEEQLVFANGLNLRKWTKGAKNTGRIIGQRICYYIAISSVDKEKVVFQKNEPCPKCKSEKLFKKDTYSSRARFAV